MKKIKVLQINAGSKNFGGVSSFLFNLYKNIDRNKYEFDFLTPNYSTYGMVKEEINKLGGNVYELKCDGLWIIKKIQICFRFSKFLKKNQYDIVHINSGSYFFNLMIAKLCKKNKIKHVIVHSHNGFNPNKKIKNYIIKKFQFILPKYSDKQLACSLLAAKSMYKEKFIKDGNVDIIRNGINIDDFKFDLSCREKYRLKFNIQSKLVIGNIGRFVEQKNHLFLLQIFNEVLKINDNAILILIGEGELEKNIKEEAKKLMIDKKIIFLGKRDDVSKLLQMMDVLVMPSLYEGLPITSIEAQATGLNMIISNNITEELKINDNVRFLDLNLNPKIWAEEIIKICYSNNEREYAYKNIEKAKYTIKKSAVEIDRIYTNLLNKKDNEMKKNELKKLIYEDKKIYDCSDFLHLIYYKCIGEKKYKFYSTIKASRKLQYYKNKNNKIIYYLPRLMYLIKFNKLSQKNRIYIKCDFGKNLKIWHEGIVVNKYSKIGDNVQFHGNNCIGNDGKNEEKCPVIGNNVNIGYGATIIGNITIADNIIIGANSLVNKSFVESNVVIAGNPARIIKKINEVDVC